VKALQFDATIPRYALGLGLSKIYQPILWSGLSCLRYRNIPEPQLQNESWVAIKTRLGGICGSDNHLIHLHNSPSASAISSFPFIVGHENCGTIAELGKSVRDYSTGERVVVNPILTCEPRGLPLCKFCARGDMQLCERMTEGHLAPGLMIGACRDTGGSWSPFFIAHQSQLVRVPNDISDENAVMLEPFATALHAVLRNMPRDDETVLVIGAGVIGLLVIASLRAVGSKARVIALARHPVQQEMARQFGADEIIAAKENDFFAEFAKLTGGKLHQPILGKRMMTGGGADVIFECVGSSDSIDDAFRFARASGRVILAGLASLPKNVDWTSVWLKELRVIGTYVYGYEEFQGKRWRAFDLALDLMKQGKVNLGQMVTHKFAIKDYANALAAVNNRGKARAVKAVFEFA